MQNCSFSPHASLRTPLAYVPLPEPGTITNMVFPVTSAAMTTGWWLQTTGMYSLRVLEPRLPEPSEAGSRQRLRKLS